MLKALTILASVGSALAGTILWDGRMNDLASSADLAKWSWGNQVGPYQYYIHGSGAITEYINLDSTFKNPADGGSEQGAKISLTSSAYWNGQNMRRTELIPQTTAAINKGKVYYHFSIKRSDTNAPSLNREHQICFFESHFTELKSGWISGAAGTSDPALRWMVGGSSKWDVKWEADVWHNVAYEIDFSANTIAFWHSTGSDPLTLTHAAVSGSTSSNGADWHLGVLELPRSGYPDSNEDFYFSGVYIESGELTTSVAGPGGVVNPPGGGSSSATTPSSTAGSTVVPTTSKPPTQTTSKPPTQTNVATAPKYGQCGGNGWSGPTVCAAGSTCKATNEWYSQCL
ncbi:hypothetical protein V493_06340 [Pseudogymnoascus sp. VKM F-4281 (FW-2241)]|nr:hypothetical protein V493_06340 [Pseudogymnoascus sp. VKM F-4281 (FW-2241)]